VKNHLIFSIRDHGKSIPYYGGNRPEGSINHGFKLLRGNLDDVNSIPEAQDNEAIKKALLALNGSESHFFTIGCEKACNKGDEGYWMRGYLEVSFNSIQFVADAQNYFRLFFKFNEHIKEQEQRNPERNPVHYSFELEGAHFLATNTDGFTLVIWITTMSLPTEDDAKREWGEAIDVLMDYLVSLRTNSSTPIYSP
jgi:hypothetical protein